ncbi:MAG: DUF2892 domain-containing protein [Bacteroidales bacterium]|nr:DUF2892 domain-containing protein [Bacteroidales bacterium]
MNNVGRIDRIIRVLLAAAILILYFVEFIPEHLMDASLAVSLLLVFTSLRKCCPLYALLGFGTCQTGAGSSNPRIKTRKLKI